MTIERSKKDLTEIASQFEIDEAVESIVLHKVGHINDTFVIITGGVQKPSYVLQRINTEVFENPVLLMENIRLVTEALNRRIAENGGDPEKEALNLVPARTGGCFLRTGDDEFYRCYRYVDGITYDFVKGDEAGVKIAREAARAFARFQKSLMDEDTSLFHVTIEDFHNTPVRYQKFLDAVKDDPLGRSEEVEKEIAFCLEREHITTIITEHIESGEIPQRITHNDTKINNIIFERDEGTPHAPRPLCVIDLDTVMPGSALFDFGDQVRTTTCPAAEDERDLEKITMDMGLYSALVEGYLEEAHYFLTERELSLLPLSGKVITLETGLRFLTDYLLGDEYFAVQRPSHNLDRARTQFELVRCMENRAGEMEGICARIRERIECENL
jgi:Ser/Thr protein kinase RdoA (MazF antagonist)